MNDPDKPDADPTLVAPGNPPTTMPNSPTSTDWQRTAARRLFQKDLPGAIEAMREAVAIDALNFHHWMWLGSLYRQARDTGGSVWSATQALRCLDEAPNTTISPEERTRLMVRTSIHAGQPERGVEAMGKLEALRRTAMDACANAGSFEEWYAADLVAAPMFETIMELYGVMGDKDQLGRTVDKYIRSLEHGMILGMAEDVEPEELEIVNARRQKALENLSMPIKAMGEA